MSTAVFLDATALLYKSAPWSILPSKHCLIGVTIEALRAHRKEIKASCNTGRSFHNTHRVSVEDLDLEVCLNLHATPDNKGKEALNALEAMALIDRTDLHDAAEKHAKLVGEVTEQFEASKEYRALKECNGGHTLIMELGFNYLDVTVASCLPADLEEVLYEIIPRKVMITPNKAGESLTTVSLFTISSNVNMITRLPMSVCAYLAPLLRIN